MIKIVDTRTQKVIREFPGNLPQTAKFALGVIRDQGPRAERVYIQIR